MALSGHYDARSWCPQTSRFENVMSVFDPKAYSGLSAIMHGYKVAKMARETAARRSLQTGVG